MPYHRLNVVTGHKLLKSYFRFVLFLPIFQTNLVNRQTCANESDNNENLLIVNSSHCHNDISNKCHSLK